ncbi:MAG: alpha-galactosidase [Clostridia bacterium]|nr:alpha-galactosidase [Clostridia bacterium]
MTKQHSFFDVYYQGGEVPEFCYRSGKMVYQEAFQGGSLIALGYNSAGYPLNLRKNEKTRVNIRKFCEPFAFNIELDGQSVDFGLELVDFKTEKDETNLKSTLVLKSTIKPVEIRVHTLLDGTQMFSRYIEIENLSDNNINLSRLSLLSGALEEFEATGDDTYSIGYFDNDEWGNEGDFSWHKLQPDVTCIDSRFGRDRFRHPLIFIRNNESGKIWFSQIAWTAGCCFTVDYNSKPRKEDKYLSFKAEIKAHNPMYVLKPHETFVSPEVHMGLVQGDLDFAVNEMHAHIRKSVLTAPWDSMIGCGMGADHDMSVETSKSYIRQFKEMGGEVFIIDAGWECPPGKETEWGPYNGINNPDKDRYPNGIKELSDYCHEMGIKFAMWIEIERMGNMCDGYKEHPEFRSNDVFGKHNQNGDLDFSISEAAKWAENELARMIEEYNLDLLRIDSNFSYPYAFFNMADTGSGVKECVSLRHFNGVYNMYQNLKKRFPDVVFENCAGGGGRTDLGMMKAFNHTWVSDCQVMPQSIIITNGMTMALPPERVDRLFAGMNCQSIGEFEAHLRNTMLTHMSLNVFSPCDGEINAEQMEFVHHSTDIYKNFIRPFLSEAMIYHHTPEARKDNVTILEVASPDKSKGAATVIALKSGAEITVKFKGADASKMYKVTLDNNRESFEITDRELRYNGINVYIPSILSSELILFEEI